MSDTDLRLFFAIRLPDDVRARLAALMEDLGKGANFTGARPLWVPPENLHLTLWFLGPVPELTAARLADNARFAMRDLAPFRLDVRHLGWFPNPKAPRVLWVDVFRPPVALQRVRDSLAPAITRTGLELPEQSFRPHVTLARLKGSPKIHDFVRMAGHHRHFQAGKFDVGEIHLMRSITGGGPARYESWASAPLAGDDGA